MTHTKKLLLTGLGMSAGTIATVLGIRAGYEWYQRRGRSQRMRIDGLRRDFNRYQPVERAFPHSVERAEREPIPATGPSAHTMPPAVPHAPPLAGAHTMPPAVPQAPPQAGAQTMPPAVPQAPPQAAPQAIPPAETPWRMERSERAPDKGTTISDTSINMDTLVGPLIDYLIAFNSMINVLRRHQESTAASGEQELTLGDREGMRNVLEQVEDRLPDYTQGQLKSGSLEARTYNLAVKIRDALGNLNNTDSDFLGLNDELSPEICAVTKAIQSSGSVSITGLDQVRQLYECGQQ